jgi:alkylated DNA repair protein (DNA oxidative demethylase)
MYGDEDEGDFDAPVLSVSLGDPAVFRVGGISRKGPTASATLEPGDVAVMGGAAGQSHGRTHPLRRLDAAAARGPDQLHAPRGAPG